MSETDSHTGDSLHRLHKEAIIESASQADILSDFRAKLAPENLARWDAEVEAFENDPSQPDPYFRKTQGTPIVSAPQLRR